LSAASAKARATGFLSAAKCRRPYVDPSSTGHHRGGADRNPSRPPARRLDCDHRATINVDNQPGHLAVKSFEARMRCAKCGGRKIDVRPNWSERPTYVAR